MASSPKWKVFNPSGEYVAACKLPEDAAAIVAAYGSGAEIRHGHAKRDTVWQDGVDGEAAESYDAVAEVCYSKVEARAAARCARFAAKHREASS